MTRRADIAFEGVSKTFPGGIQAVKSLDLSIPDGEFLVIVGPSGCGKSTTLRMLAGLEDIDAGTIRIGGQPVNHVHPKDRDIAMVFQDYALYPHMTVAENVGFSLRMRRYAPKEIESRVREAAHMLDIEELLPRRPKSLSGGQRQRVALGRAIVRRPLVFLLDEPLSNLDGHLRNEMRGELKKLHGQLKTTTLHVTHDQEEAMSLGDRILVMQGGELQQIGPPLEVYNRPVNRFVAGFIGQPPMNLFPGWLRGRRNEARFEHGFLNVPLGPGKSHLVEERLDSEVTLGIRPEDLRLVEEVETRDEREQGEKSDASEVTADFSARVLFSEPLGDRTDLHVMTDSDLKIIARLPPQQACPPGQRVRLRLDVKKIHIFGPGPFGINLTLD